MDNCPGFLVQVALGAVYAWSVFRLPLTKQFGWSISEVTLTFTISIFVVGHRCFFRWSLAESHRTQELSLSRAGFCTAWESSCRFLRHRLWWLYLSYGVIGGTGVGLSYIVPVAVLGQVVP